MLVLAIVLTAVGISLTAGMKLIPNPGEGAAGAIGIALKKDFGYGKNVLDLGCVALSIAITLIFSGRISNIGIGTVLSMLVTGCIGKLFPRPPESYTKSLLNHKKTPKDDFLRRLFFKKLTPYGRLPQFSQSGNREWS